MRLVLVLFVVLSVASAHAQDLVGRVEGPADRVAGWTLRIAERGAEPIAEVAVRRPHIERARLRVLVEAERLLVEARTAAVQFEEARALSLLTRARDLLERSADVPGSSQWLAEAETITGIVAAQSGQASLSDASLARAVSLDATRIIKPGETAPAVVQRVRELATARATAPRGRFNVRSPVAGARVFLDDQEIGGAPVLVQATVGRHVLRVEAPGHRMWGQAIDVLEGNRADMDIVLAETSRRSALRRIQTAPTLRAAAEAAATLGTRVWWVEVGDGPRDRALLYECAESGCSAPVRLSAEGGWTLPGAPIPWDRLVRARRSAWAWLRELPSDPILPGRRPLARRWELWVPIAAIVAAGAFGLGFGLRPDPPDQFLVSIDPGDVAVE